MSDTEGIYFRHDNGGRPFKVIVEKNNDVYDVFVYKMAQEENEYEDNAILTFKSDMVFIGQSPLNKMTRYSGGHGAKFAGNTILLHLHDNIYVSIGWEIFSFETNSKITSYVSPVGNSDVPYPYATDEDGDIYLIINDVVIKNNTELANQMRYYDDPYTYYYDYSCITENIGTNPPKQPKTKYFKNIARYYIGEDEYTLRYYPYPEKDYDRLIPELGTEMYTINTTGKKKILTKEIYVDLMHSFALARFFGPIHNKTILQKRLW